MKLYFVRHGEVQGARDTIYGHADLALTDRGATQAEAAARYLADRIHPRHPIAAVYASDLARARIGAEKVVAACAKTSHTPPLKTDPRLREMSMGILDGLPRASAAATYPALLKLTYRDMVTARFPEGETVTEVSERVWHAVDEIVAHHAPRNEDAVIVAHNTTTRVVIARVLNLSLADALSHFAQPYGAISCVSFPAPRAASASDVTDPIDTAHPRVEFLSLVP